MATEVLVVQHGEKARTAGDPGLTETGVCQAAAVADGVPCGAITRLEVAEAVVSVVGYPSADHL